MKLRFLLLIGLAIEMALSTPAIAEFTPGIRNKYIGELDAINESESTAKKLLLAHAMQYMFPDCTNAGGDVSVFDIQSYVPNGVNKLTGGLFEDLPLRAFHAEKGWSVESAKKEIELAQEAGIDGIIYFYTVNDKTSALQNAIVSKLFAAAKEMDRPFYITVAIAPRNIGRFDPSSDKVEKKASLVTKWLGELLKIVGKDHPSWLRTPNGKIILFTHQAAMLGTGVASEVDLAPKFQNRIDEKMDEIADGYYSILNDLSLDACYVFRAAPFEMYTALLKLPDDQKQEAYRKYLAAACRNFPFLKWFRFDPTTEQLASFERDVNFIKNANRSFVPSIFFDSYTTRKFDDSEKQIKSPKHLQEPGFDPQKLFARCGYTGNSTYITTFWNNVLKFAPDARLIEVITWNDYMEGHGMAPSLNHCFGQNTIVKHFKHIWQTGEPPTYGTSEFPEEVVVFYKKYRHDIKPSLFDYPVTEKVDRFVPRAFWEKMRDISDQMDVCCFLREPSTVVINGQSFEAPKGYSMFRVAPNLGAQHVEVVRDGKEIIDFRPTEWTTDKPYRTDRFTFIQSSRWKEIYRKLFPTGEMHYLNEYEEDEKGVPNWKKWYPDILPTGSR